MIFRLKLVLFIFFSFFFFLPVVKSEEVIYKMFDIRTESSRPKITKLFRDNNGQLWAGTDKGVFKFDGSDFYKIPGTDSSLFQTVTAFFQDKDKIIWVGFSTGKILQIIGSKTILYNPQEGFPKVSITGFALDQAQHLYFCTKGEGIYCIERNRMYNIDENDGLSDNYCYSITETSDQRICVGTDAGINFVQFENGKKKVTVFNADQELPDDIVRSVIGDGNGNLWIGMQDKGISLFNYKSNTLINPLTEKWKYGPVIQLILIETNLWILTEEHGIIIRKKNGQLIEFPLNIGRTYNPVDLISDLENNIWIAESIHLIRTSGIKIQFLSEIDNTKIKNVHCILNASDESVYFSPDNQLSRIKKDAYGKWHIESIQILMGKNPPDIVTLYEDHYGFIWAGTMGEGVFRYNPATKKTRHIIEGKSIESASILSINGEGNQIWVAGFNGVNQYTLSNGASENASILKETKLQDNGILSTDYIYSVFIDSKKRTWFGTDENGAYYLENGKLKNLHVPGNTVHSFAEDPTGRIWVGTAEGGIVIFSDDTIIQLEPRQGLSEPSVSGLQSTQTGKIIMVYNNGFDIINPTDLSILYHSTEENLSDLNADLNSITSRKNGQIYIGTEKGIIIYSPDEDLKLQQPHLILNGVSVFLEDIDYKKNSKFAYDENNLHFEYSGLWYSDPKRVNYSYLLEGYSAKWQQTKDHSITFPKLLPGTYTFKIKASLNNNFKNADEISFKFVIRPPIWQRWWFRIVAAAIIALSIFFLIHYRDKRVRNYDRVQKEKVEMQFETLKSQVNPHFLFNSFNTLISVIEKSPVLAIEYVEHLSEFFRSIINYRDKNLIPLAEELELMENYIFIQKKRYGENLIVIERLNDDLVKKLFIPPLTLQLLAENAIKHNSVSRETTLTITLSFDQNKLSVSNNINSKISKETPSGFGLQTIISRFKLLSEEEVEIKKDEQSFNVLLPLINREYS